MTNVYFHIGVPKTASTFLQGAIARNARGLEAFGFHYPKSILEYDYTQRLFCFSFLDQKFPGILNSDSFSIDKETIRKSYRRIIEASSFDNFVFSGERLTSHLSRTDFEGFGRFFAPFNVRLIVFLRRQDLLLESLYRESIRSFNIAVDDIFDFHDKFFDGDYFNFDKMLAPWAEIVGEENISVVVFEDEQLPHGVFPEFLRVLGLPPEAGRRLNALPTHPIDQNRMLKREHIEFLRRIKRHDVPEDVRRSLQGVLNELSTTEDIGTVDRAGYLTSEQRLAFLGRFAESNAAVTRRYLGRRDGRLFYADPATEPEPSHAPAGTDDFLGVGLGICEYLLAGKGRWQDHKFLRLGMRARFALYRTLWPSATR